MKYNCLVKECFYFLENLFDKLNILYHYKLLSKKKAACKAPVISENRGVCG